MRPATFLMRWSPTNSPTNRKPEIDFTSSLVINDDKTPALKAPAALPPVSPINVAKAEPFAQVASPFRPPTAPEPLKTVKAATKDNGFGMSSYETIKLRSDKLKSIADPDERSFELNKRIYNGFAPIPMTQTSTSDYPNYEPRLVRAIHSDADDYKKHKGDFTTYLRQAICKNINLKQTGHA